KHTYALDPSTGQDLVHAIEVLVVP
ncbi:MAG: hypothetical protein ACI9MB_003700, partial [Verrucomicrobiales bacterium]